MTASHVSKYTDHFTETTQTKHNLEEAKISQNTAKQNYPGLVTFMTLDQEWGGIILNWAQLIK